VPENVAVSTDVVAAVAVGPDEGAGGRIACEREASGLLAFSHTMGYIITGRALTHLMVRAKDGVSPSFSRAVLLSIFIGDVFTNDEDPLFVRPRLSEAAKVSDVRFLL
jgi:hypothetical protein